MSALHASAASVLLTFCLLGCVEAADQTVGTTDSAATDSDTTSDDSGMASEGSEQVDPDGVCAQYIDCVAAVAPNTTAAAVEGFGPEGTCWTPSTTDVCVQACVSARQELGALFPTESACWDCRTDSDCNDTAPFCDTNMGVCGVAPPPQEFGGPYLMALSLATAPEFPLQFIVDISTTDDSATCTLQPLSLDLQSTTTPREEVGEPQVVGGAFLETFFFCGGQGGVRVPAAADPISGSDLWLELTLEAFIRDDNTWCGDAFGFFQGQNPSPSLEGSTFAAIHLSDRDERPIVFPRSCAELDAK